MARRVKLKASLSGNVNKFFRLETKLLHILRRNFPVKQTPVLINNYNRLGYLEQQVEWLNSVGMHNLYIIDNASNYPPLLRYYKKVKATVFLLDKNMGHEAFWRTHLFQRFGHNFYVLTDPDVLPDEKTPVDFIEYFYDLLMRYPLIKKVGFGLRIDDLPDYYPRKNEVINWEKKFFENEIEPGVYKASIDTTFALYRPAAFFQCWDETLRTGSPYMLRHMPWYENPLMLDNEAKYYFEKAGESSSWYQSVKGNDSRYD